MAAQLELTLYRSLLRAARDFERCQIPCVGVIRGAHSSHAGSSLDVTSSFRLSFKGHSLMKETKPTVDDAFSALRGLRSQLSVLQQCDEETRGAMAAWSYLFRVYRKTMPSFQQQHQQQQQHPLRQAMAMLLHAQGIEYSALLLHRLHCTMFSGIPPEDDMEDELADGWAYKEPEEQVGAAREMLDLLSEEVLRKSPPALFPPMVQSLTVESLLHRKDNYGDDDDDDDADSGGGDDESSSLRRETDELDGASSSSGSGSCSRSRSSDNCSVSGAVGGGSSSDMHGAEDSEIMALHREHQLRNPQAPLYLTKGSVADRDTREQQLSAIAAVLLQGSRRMKHTPVEWVYDGLRPLMLPDVLRRRKGIPLMLATTFSAVAARLGIPTIIVRASSRSGAAATASGPSSLSSDDGMPPELAARQAGRLVQLMPPAPDCWLVASPYFHMGSTGGDGSSDTGSSSGGSTMDLQAGSLQGMLVVDVDRKAGQVLDAKDAVQQYPVMHINEVSGTRASSYLINYCAELTRTAMVAHQRRGESDLVAHYLYQVLALDPSAPEWSRALDRSHLRE